MFLSGETLDTKSDILMSFFLILVTVCTSPRSIALAFLPLLVLAVALFRGIVRQVV